jgi:tetratricopeptide (TPR) repeat protein
MMQSSATMSQAIAQIEENTSAERSTVTLLDFLKMVFAVSLGDIEQAVEVVKQNTELMGDALLLSGVLEEKSVNSAKLCCLLIERGVMPLEQACIIFDLAQREKITIPEAIARMHWSTGDIDDTLSLSEQADMHERLWQMSESVARQCLATGAADTEQKLTMLIALAEKLPEGDLRLPHALELMADFKCQSKAYDEAKTLLKEAIKLRTQVVGKTDLSVGRTFNNLAKIYYLQSNYEDAQKFCQRFLLICQGALGADHPDVACGLTNLGSIFHVQGKLLEAEAAYKESLKICEVRLGREHPATLRNLRAYAALLREMNREYDAHQLDLRLIGEFTGSWKTISP